MSTRIKRRKKLPALKLVGLGAALLRQGKHAQAEQAWRQAVDSDALCAPAWSYLTDYLAVSQRTSEASECLQHLIAASDPSAETLYILADKCCFLKHYGQARQLLNEALDLNPARQTWLDASLLLVKIDFTENEWLAAIAGASRILAVEPAHLEALQVRQRSYFCLGWATEDVADCRLYLKLKPENDRHQRLLFKLNYLPETTPELLYEESTRWNDLYAKPLADGVRAHKNIADPERRLKIGYVSPDLRNHAMMKLLPGVLENHDRQHFEIFAYSIETKHDEVTAQVQRSVDHFVELPASRNEIANRVRSDGIDILVDLAGHTLAPDALLAFALKPAPVQLTWMGSLATTGLSSMDYFMGDAQMPCPGTEHLFSETVYRLPRTHCCYRPLVDPGLTPSPYFKNSYITFGSFNDMRKINRGVVQVWSVILHFHPDSRLLFKYTNLEREIVQRRLRAWFAEDGIAPERLRFEGAGSPLNFLETISQADIALDPFPYGGGTTTMETLWMGVPVISVAGRTAVARSGSCLLSALGFPVATSLEQYIALAASMARTIPDQTNLRARVRAALVQSDLLDERGMARAIEAAYRDMWNTWCQKAVAENAVPAGTTL